MAKFPSVPPSCSTEVPPQSSVAPPAPAPAAGGKRAAGRVMHHTTVPADAARVYAGFWSHSAAELHHHITAGMAAGGASSLPLLSSPELANRPSSADPPLADWLAHHQLHSAGGGSVKLMTPGQLFGLAREFVPQLPSSPSSHQPPPSTIEATAPPFLRTGGEGPLLLLGDGPEGHETDNTTPVPHHHEVAPPDDEQPQPQALLSDLFFGWSPHASPTTEHKPAVAKPKVKEPSFFDSARYHWLCGAGGTPTSEAGSAAAELRRANGSGSGSGVFGSPTPIDVVHDENENEGREADDHRYRYDEEDELLGAAFYPAGENHDDKEPPTACIGSAPPSLSSCSPSPLQWHRVVRGVAAENEGTGFPPSSSANSTGAATDTPQTPEGTSTASTSALASLSSGLANAASIVVRTAAGLALAKAPRGVWCNDIVCREFLRNGFCGGMTSASVSASVGEGGTGKESASPTATGPCGRYHLTKEECRHYLSSMALLGNPVRFCLRHLRHQKDPKGKSPCKSDCSYYHGSAEEETAMLRALSRANPAEVPGAMVCRCYLQHGKCTFGGNCHYLHPLKREQFAKELDIPIQHHRSAAPSSSAATTVSTTGSTVSAKGSAAALRSRPQSCTNSCTNNSNQSSIYSNSKASAGKTSNPKKK